MRKALGACFALLSVSLSVSSSLSVGVAGLSVGFVGGFSGISFAEGDAPPVASDETEPAAIEAVLRAVDALRAAPPTRDLDDMIQRLRSDFGRNRMHADQASRRLRGMPRDPKSEEYSRLVEEHGELSRAAHENELLIRVLREVQREGNAELLGLPRGDSIAFEDVDRLAAWVDEILAKIWERRGLEPAPMASDATFLRRASLDIAGVVPSLEQSDRFFSANESGGRGRWIDTLVESPEYARHWADYWNVHLIGRGYLPDDKHRQPFVDWLRQEFAKNTPYDQFFDQLLTNTKVTTKQVSPAIFLAARQSDAIANTNKILQSFLGMQLSCSECHDAPYQRFTQDDFHSLVAFMARQKEKDTGGNVYVLQDRDRGEAHYSTPVGTRHVASMRYYDGTKFSDYKLDEKGEALKDDKGKPLRADLTRRQMFSAAIRSDLQFARTQVNRMWSLLLGRGLVEPVFAFTDDSRSSLPLILDGLARKFQESGFDNRWLIRVICRTRAYQLSSAPVVGSEYLVRSTFATYSVKALSAEQMVESVVRAAGLRPSLRAELDSIAPEDVKSAGKKSGRLLKSMAEGFVKVYGWEPDKVIDENEGTLPQTLALLNSRLVAEAIRDRPSSLVDEVRKLDSFADRVRRLYRATLVREPTARDMASAENFLAENSDPASDPGSDSGGEAAKISDILWSLLNSAEFRYNH